jgi:hypothetical protein
MEIKKALQRMIWPFSRKPEPDPVPAPKHAVSFLVENPRFGGGDDDFRSGWCVHCKCGWDNSKLNWRLALTEEEALEQYTKHELTAGPFYYSL